MVQSRRRSPLPFVIAALVAVLLIVGVRLLTGGGGSDSGDGDGGNDQALPCTGDRVTLNVAASSEKAELVKQLAASYHQGSPQVSGRCVQRDNP